MNWVLPLVLSLWVTAFMGGLLFVLYKITKL